MFDLTTPDTSPQEGPDGKVASVVSPSMLSGWAEALASSPDFRVLRRMVPKKQYCQALGSVGHGLLIDTETTGLKSGEDKIIEMALVPFTFDKDAGTVCDVEEAYTGFEDPGFSLSKEIVDLTGITDEMVRGQRIDDARVTEMVTRADIVIAHNAGFDRPFSEARFPLFETKAWACSQRDVDWTRHGFKSQKLEWLLDRGQHVFYDAHRAEVDCQATLYLLAMPLGSGVILFGELLESARQKRGLLWAFGAPFEQKDTLKDNGYRWFAGDSQFDKAWRKEVDLGDLETELAWLRARVYQGDGVRKARCSDLGPRVRYSNRVGRWKSDASDAVAG